MAERVRLDVALVQRGLTSSRQRAQSIIQGGHARVNGVVVTKAAHLCGDVDDIEINDPLRYVGRGGLKLEAALDAFAIDPAGRVCMDVGASTGGFTHCLLERGAVRVYAIDVGSGQLAPKLAADERVCAMEETDVRSLLPGALVPPPSLAVCDVSFISLKLVLPAIASLLDTNGRCVLLVKPQFEAGRQHVGKGGIVKDAKVHASVLNSVIDAAKGCSFTVAGLEASPITGGDGNIEYLLYLSREAFCTEVDVEGTVRAAHLRLKKR